MWRLLFRAQAGLMIAGTVQSLICSYRTLLQVLQLGRALQIKSCSDKLRRAYAMLRCLSCPVLGCFPWPHPSVPPRDFLQQNRQGLKPELSHLPMCRHRASSACDTKALFWKDLVKSASPRQFCFCQQHKLLQHCDCLRSAGL